MRKPLIALSSIATVSLLAAGCGSPASTGAATTTKTSTNSTNTSGATTDAKSPIQLTYDYPVGVAGPLAKIMSSMVDQFNQTHPSIHVTPVFSGNYQQTLAKVETAIQGGNPPDVAVLNSTAVYDLLHLQAIAPLDDVVNAGNFYPAFIQPQVNGHYWGVPFQRSTVVLYYNKDMFKKAGLDANHGPNTWSELVSDASAIKSKLGVNGIEIPSDGTTYWTFEPWATEAGQNLGGNDGKHVYFNSQAAKKALNFWLDLSNKYHVMPAGILQWNTVPTDFEQQKTAMITHSSGSMTSILKQSNFNVGVAFLPMETGTQRTGLGGGDMFVMQGISKQKHDAAVTFVQWMTSPAQAAVWTMQTGYIGDSPDVYKQAAMVSYLKQYPQAQVAADQLKYAQPELSTYSLNQVYDVIDSALQSVMDGQASTNSALDKAQKQANSILAQFQ